MKINKQQAKALKKSILKKLTEDSENNQAIFDKKEGWAVFNGTDLSMVMDKVVSGVYAMIGEDDE